VEADLGGRIGLPVKDRNTSGFLAAVLQGVQTEIGEVGDGLVLGQYRKDPTGLLRLIRALGHSGSRLQIVFSIVHQG